MDSARGEQAAATKLGSRRMKRLGDWCRRRRLQWKEEKNRGLPEKEGELGQREVIKERKKNPITLNQMHTSDTECH